MYYIKSNRYGEIKSDEILDLANKYWKLAKEYYIEKDIQKSEVLKDFSDIMKDKNLFSGEVGISKKHDFVIEYKEKK